MHEGQPINQDNNETQIPIQDVIEAVCDNNMWITFDDYTLDQLRILRRLVIVGRKKRPNDLTNQESPSGNGYMTYAQVLGGLLISIEQAIEKKSSDGGAEQQTLLGSQDRPYNIPSGYLAEEIQFFLDKENDHLDRPDGSRDTIYLKIAGETQKWIKAEDGTWQQSVES